VPSIYISPSVQKENIGVDGVTEAERMQALGREIAQRLSPKVTVYLNRLDWKLNEIINDSNRKKPDLHLALHSNAGGGTGVETWTYKTSGTRSADFGCRLQGAVIRAIGLPNRGLKDGTVPGQIIGEVLRTEATSVLIELFFHDNYGDVEAFKHNRGAIVDAIVKTVLDWFGIEDSPAAVFPDIREHWARESIERVARAGLMLGDDRGLFRPEDSLTRAEFAVALDRLLKADGGGFSG
jgi:N-acetylmuramoyl-L-alanine amidase